MVCFRDLKLGMLSDHAAPTFMGAIIGILLPKLF